MDGFKFYEDLFKLGEVYPCIVTNKIMMHDNIKTGGYEVIIKGNKGIGFIDSGLIADGFENLNIDDEAEFIVCGFDEERGLKFEPTIQTMKAKGMTPRLLKGKITAVSNEKLAYHVPNPLLKRAHLTEERRKLLEKQEIHFMPNSQMMRLFGTGCVRIMKLKFWITVLNRLLSVLKLLTACKLSGR